MEMLIKAGRAAVEEILSDADMVINLQSTNLEPEMTHTVDKFK